MDYSISVSKHDWSLHRKGPVDQARHNAKVKEAIKDNLPGIISEEAIITSDGNRVVKVPIRSLDLPHFRFKLNGSGLIHRLCRVAAKIENHLLQLSGLTG